MAITSKSSIVSGTPASRAMASRWSTPLVEPPVAAIDAIAFSKASRVRIDLGRIPFSSRRIASWPASKAAWSFLWSMAGISLAPAGLSPRNSITVDMVLAVNWPPQAPAPGQAASSMASSSGSPIEPAARAPTASKTSISVMSRPSYRPAPMVPL